MQRFQELINSHRLLTREVESIREKIGTLMSRQSIASNKMTKIVEEMTECHKDLYRTAISYEDQIFTREDQNDFSVMNIDHPFENQEKNRDQTIDRKLIKKEHTEAICHWQGTISIQHNQIKMVGPLIITAGDIEEYRSSLEGSFRLDGEVTSDATFESNPPNVLIIMRCSNKSNIVVESTNQTKEFKAILKITDKRSLRIEKMYLIQKHSDTQNIDLDVRGNFVYKSGMAEMDLIAIGQEEKYTD